MKTTSNVRSGRKISARLVSVVAGVILCGAITKDSQAAITMTASDATGTTSFSEAGNWSDGLAPSADKDYETSRTLRTAADSTADFVFQGNSLTLLTNGSLVFKGKSTTTVTPVITVDNLIMKGGSVVNQYTGQTFILAGNIQLASGYTSYFTINSTNQGYTVSSAISGSGALTVKVNSSMITSQLAQASYGVTFNSANTWSGGMTIEAYTYVTAAVSGAFGTGNVTVNGGKVILQSGSSIGDSANLILASSLALSSVTLSFTGTEVVGGLSLDGGSTYLDIGTYSISELNGLYGSNVFAGSDAYIQVIPEPSTWMQILLGLFLLALVGYSHKKNLCFQ